MSLPAAWHGHPRWVCCVIAGDFGRPYGDSAMLSWSRDQPLPVMRLRGLIMHMARWPVRVVASVIISMVVSVWLARVDLSSEEPRCLWVAELLWEREGSRKPYFPGMQPTKISKRKTGRHSDSI